MTPVFDQVNEVAVQPYMNGNMSAIAALTEAAEPFKSFMLAQTRETDIRMFADIAGVRNRVTGRYPANVTHAGLCH